MAAPDYASRLSRERQIYEQRETVHDLPAIFHYWSHNNVRPKLQALGFDTLRAFFRDPLAERCMANPGARFLSVGAGNCDREIELALDLRTAGHTGFTIDCLEMNTAMLERGRTAAERAGVGENFAFLAEDFNAWRPQREYEGAVAIEALHHVTNLEGLFAGIRESLTKNGVFVIVDTIGRNGHLRWPEAMAIVHEFWRKLPPSYRFNRQLQRYEEWFEDWDCSMEGFEGVRAQDILPLLIETFHFQKFAAYGNVIDPFVDRSFGPNFDASAEWDRGFIDAVHRRDEEELARGGIKPTHMFAIVGKDSDAAMQFLEPLTPAFCVRRQSDCAASSVVAPGTAYEFEGWSHRMPDELEFVCRRLAKSEREVQEIRKKARELHATLLETEERLDDRTAWALKLGTQLNECAALHAGLHREVGVRTEWALDLEKQLDERTKWALQLQQEVQELTLRAESDRTLWRRLRKLMRG